MKNWGGFFFKINLLGPEWWNQGFKVLIDLRFSQEPNRPLKQGNSMN